MKAWPAVLCSSVFALASLSLTACKPAPNKALPNWFWGCWIVKKDLMVKDISALRPKQVHALIGTGIVFTPSYARWGQTLLNPAKYSVKVLSNDQFFSSGTYNNLDDIGIKEERVTEVNLDLPDKLSDLDFPGEDVYLRKDDIVIEVEGAYLSAKKAKPDNSACQARPYKIKLPWEY